MNNQTKEIQKTLLVLAKNIKEICDKHGIDYSLEGGSLLGAVRHQGFIPWDNDFDFFMTRENYDKFIKFANDELDKGYEILTYHTYPNYPFSFAKIMIRDKPITYSDQFFSFPTKLHIDVFPFDGVAKGYIKQLFQKKKAIYYKRMLIIHDGGQPERSASPNEKRLFALAKIISKFYSHNGLVKKSEKNLRKYPHSNKMSIMMGFYGYNKTMLDANDLKKYTYLNFEGEQFKCIECYDKYLTQLYGDYMELPPIEKRVGHDFVLDI